MTSADTEEEETSSGIRSQLSWLRPGESSHWATTCEFRSITTNSVMNLTFKKQRSTATLGMLLFNAFPDSTDFSAEEQAGRIPAIYREGCEPPLSHLPVPSQHEVSSLRKLQLESDGCWGLKWVWRTSQWALPLILGDGTQNWLMTVSNRLGQCGPYFIQVMSSTVSGS